MCAPTHLQVAPAAPAVPEPVDEAAREALLHECCRVMLSDPEVLRTRATTHAEFAKRKGRCGCAWAGLGWAVRHVAQVRAAVCGNETSRGIAFDL